MRPAPNGAGPALRAIRGGPWCHVLLLRQWGVLGEGGREEAVGPVLGELAGEVNQAMPCFCADKIASALNEHEKAVRGSRVAIIGVSYKPGWGTCASRRR